MLKTDHGPVRAPGTSVQPREGGHVCTDQEKTPGKTEDLHGRVDMTDQGNHAKRRRERGQPESLATAVSLPSKWCVGCGPLLFSAWKSVSGESGEGSGSPILIKVMVEDGRDWRLCSSSADAWYAASLDFRCRQVPRHS